VIRSRTGGRVRDLRIEVRGSRVLLQGQCATFYSKQLASHAAMPLIGTRELFNEIVVE
jgi:osmotically-inducible protein OsmY